MGDVAGPESIEGGYLIWHVSLSFSGNFQLIIAVDLVRICRHIDLPDLLCEEETT